MLDHLISQFTHWHETLTPTEQLGFDFFVVIILIRGILAKKISATLEDLLRRMLIRTERDLAIWLHYRNQSMNKGHKHDTPIDCEDGPCKLV